MAGLGIVDFLQNGVFVFCWIILHKLLL